MCCHKNGSSEGTQWLGKRRSVSTMYGFFAKGYCTYWQRITWQGFYATLLIRNRLDQLSHKISEPRRVLPSKRLSPAGLRPSAQLLWGALSDASSLSHICSKVVASISPRAYR